MKLSVSLPLTVLCAIVLVPPCVAEPIQQSTPIEAAPQRAPVLVGPVVGMNRNFHSGGFRTITSDEACPIFSNGSGWGFLAGVTAEIALSPVSAVIPRLTYESRPGSFESRLPDALVLPRGATDVIKQSVTASSSVSYTLFGIEGLYKHEVGTLGAMRIALAAGPALGVVIADNNRQVQDLVEPTNAVFTNPQGYPVEEGGRRIVFYDAPIPARTDLRFSLKAGVQAEVLLFGGTWYMTPGLYYDYGLSDVTRADNWQLNSLMFMVDFRRGL
jgi:hypothetical protein